MDIRSKIREFRKNNHKTQLEIAQILNLPLSTYRNYELGVAEPNIAILEKLSDLYDVTVDELLGREQGQQLFDDARVERPEILDVYEQLTPEQQAHLLNYARGMATANELAGAPAQTQKKTDIV